MGQTGFCENLRFPAGFLRKTAVSCLVLLFLGLILSNEFPWLFALFHCFFQGFSGFGRGQQSLANLRVFPWQTEKIKERTGCGFVRKSALPKCCDFQEIKAKFCKNQRKSAKNCEFNWVGLSHLVCPF